MNFLFNFYTYDALLTVAFDGPLTTKFLNPPINFKFPLPRETVTALIRNGSNGRTPISGIPCAKWGKIPSNIVLKQLSLLGSARLHCVSQSARIEKKKNKI